MKRVGDLNQSCPSSLVPKTKFQEENKHPTQESGGNHFISSSLFHYSQFKTINKINGTSKKTISDQQ